MRRVRAGTLAILALAFAAVLLLPETAQAQRRGLFRRRNDNVIRYYYEPITTRYYEPMTVRYIYPWYRTEIEPNGPRPAAAEELPPPRESERVTPSAGTVEREANTAKLSLMLPTDTTEVWVDDKCVKGNGTKREVTTPSLKPGERHTFAVTSRWVRDNEAVMETREIDVYAGDRVTLDFTRPARRPATEVEPKELPEPKP